MKLQTNLTRTENGDSHFRFTKVSKDAVSHFFLQIQMFQHNHIVTRLKKNGGACARHPKDRLSPLQPSDTLLVSSVGTFHTQTMIPMECCQRTAGSSSAGSCLTAASKATTLQTLQTFGEKMNNRPERNISNRWFAKSVTKMTDQPKRGGFKKTEIKTRKNQTFSVSPKRNQKCFPGHVPVLDQVLLPDARPNGRGRHLWPTSKV